MFNLAPHLDLLELSWVYFGAMLDTYEAILGFLGPILGSLGAILDLPWGILGALGASLRPSWNHFEVSWPIWNSPGAHLGAILLQFASMLGPF